MKEELHLRKSMAGFRNPSEYDVWNGSSHAYYEEITEESCTKGQYYPCEKCEYKKELQEAKNLVEQLKSQVLRQAGTICDKVNENEWLKGELQEAKEEIESLKNHTKLKDSHIDQYCTNLILQNTKNEKQQKEIEQLKGEANRVYELMRMHCKYYLAETMCCAKQGHGYTCALSRADCHLFAEKEWPDRIELEETRYITNNPCLYNVVLERKKT